jgi:hypothetical protein
MDYPVINGRSDSYPVRHYGGHYTGGSVMTFCENGDLLVPDARVRGMPNSPVTVLSENPISVAPEFFGMHANRRAFDRLPGIMLKTARGHDLQNGKGRWRFIETSDNTWTFTDLDAWVNTHYDAGRDLLFTLYGTPTWASARPTEIGAYGPGNPGTQAEPADMSKWDRFCAKIASRYRGKIKYYEVWNEPNMYNDGTAPIPGTTFFFSGTFAKLAEIVRRANIAIKAVDPTAKIVSPAVTNWAAKAGQSAETYFTGMMAAPTGDGSTTMKDWVDIIGVHLYLSSGNSTADLAGIIDRVNAAKAAAGVSSMETWDTESAPIAPNASALSDDQLDRYLTRFMVTAAAKGIARTMYYQWDNDVMGFRERINIGSRWNALRELLLSGSILSASKLFDGRLIYRTSTGTTIV